MIYRVSWGNLRYWLTCKAWGETRVTTRTCFMWRTSVVYLIVRPSVGPELKHDDEPCILKKLVHMYLLVRHRVRRELRLENVSCEELVCLVNCKAFGGSRVKTRWCIMYLRGATCAIYLLVSLGWDESYDSKMLLVQDLWCLPNCKTFGWSRVKTRCCIMYLEKTCALYLLVRPWVRRVLRLRNVSCEGTCAAYVIVRPSVGRDVPYLSTHATVLTISTSHRPGKHSQDLDMFKYRRIEVEIKTRCCIIYLCGETCIIYLLVRPWARREWRLENASWRTCVVYLIVRPSVGRGLRLDDISCILGGQLALFSYL